MEEPLPQQDRWLLLAVPKLGALFSQDDKQTQWMVSIKQALKQWHQFGAQPSLRSWSQQEDF